MGWQENRGHVVMATCAKILAELFELLEIIGNGLEAFCVASSLFSSVVGCCGGLCVGLGVMVSFKLCGNVT